MHASEGHSYVVAAHSPPKHASLYVQSSPSSHGIVVRHAQVPPAFVQWYVEPPHVSSAHSVWLAVVHWYVSPPVQIPSAFAGPHPAHVCPTVNETLPHTSGHPSTSV
jgi:hypothetical protein